MATLVPMELNVWPEKRSDYDATGTAYFIRFTSADGAKDFWIIFGSGAPSTNYNDAPLDSIYIDTTAHMIYYHTAAATWAEIGDVT